MLVAAAHELEEEHGPGRGDGQVADLVHHEEARVGQHLEPVLQPAGGLGLLERGDQVGQGAVVDPPAALGRGDGQADGQMSLPDARRAEEDHVLPALQEAELVEARDLLPLDRGLKGEVEVFEGLHGRQPGGPHGGLQPSGVAEPDLGAEELLDRFGPGHRPAVHAGEDVIDGLQGTGHLEVGELGPDSVPAGRGLHPSAPAIWAYTESGRCSTATVGTGTGRAEVFFGVSIGSTSER